MIIIFKKIYIMDIKDICNLDGFFLCFQWVILSDSTNWLWYCILAISDIKHIMRLPIKRLMSVFKVLRHIIDSIAVGPIGWSAILLILSVKTAVFIYLHLLFICRACLSCLYVVPILLNVSNNFVLNQKGQVNFFCHLASVFINFVTF